MFHVMQMPGVNPVKTPYHFQVIEGKMSPAGYPLGKYRVCLTHMTIDQARDHRRTLEKIAADVSE